MPSWRWRWPKGIPTSNPLSHYQRRTPDCRRARNSRCVSSRHHHDAAPAVILLHRFPEDWYEFHLIVPRLAKTFTVVAVDLRGVGKSAPSESGYDESNLAGGHSPDCYKTSVGTCLRGWAPRYRRNGRLSHHKGVIGFFSDISGILRNDGGTKLVLSSISLLNTFYYNDFAWNYVGIRLGSRRALC
jgi:pimeloyl-ACP methyl ester carboxylesterase